MINRQRENIFLLLSLATFSFPLTKAQPAKQELVLVGSMIPVSCGLNYLSYTYLFKENMRNYLGFGVVFPVIGLGAYYYNKNSIRKHTTPCVEAVNKVEVACALGSLVASPVGPLIPVYMLLEGLSECMRP